MFQYLINFTEQKWHQKLYYFISYLLITSYIIASFGIYSLDPNYLKLMQDIIKIYIAINLILRFNPYYKLELNKNNYEFNRRIAFSSGIFLLISSGIFSYFYNIFL